MLTFPNINPVLLNIGPLQLHYYALSYLITIVISYCFLKYKNKKLQITNSENIESFATHCIFSIILGGRLGYVIFYDLKYYLANPLQIFQIWEGGMAWHGAFIGIVITCYLFSRKHQIPFFALPDVIVRTIPIGFFLGRITNFLNQELIGRSVDPNFPLAITFPNDPYQIPRHPSQLYEAFAEGLILLLIINFIAWKFLKKSGLNTLVFVIGYAIARIICEFFRQPDPQIGFIGSFFTLGQLFSVFMIMSSIITIICMNNQQK